LAVVLLTVPGLRDAFNFGPMEPWEWLVALVAGSLGVAWFEAYKLRVRR
jgi:Ca2+-transporting ATPase